MELDVAGASHCAVDSCHQLDFLPFRCDACSQTFCQHHFAYASHACQRAGGGSVQVIICPLCKETIRLVQGEDANTTWERHFFGKCPQAPREGAAAKGPKRCPVQGCKEQLGLSNRFECQRCGQVVCLRHRAQEDHPCEQKPSAGSAASRTRSAPAARPAPAVATPASAAPSRSSRGAAPAAQSGGQAQHLSDDERLARELQEHEIAMAQAHGGVAFQQSGRERGSGRASSQPPPAARSSRRISSRIASMFACFKTPRTGGDRSPGERTPLR